MSRHFPGDEPSSGSSSHRLRLRQSMTLLPHPSSPPAKRLCRAGPALGGRPGRAFTLVPDLPPSTQTRTPALPGAAHTHTGTANAIGTPRPARFLSGNRGVKASSCRRPEATALAGLTILQMPPKWFFLIRPNKTSPQETLLGRSGLLGTGSRLCLPRPALPSCLLLTPADLCLHVPGERLSS